MRPLRLAAALAGLAALTGVAATGCGTTVPDTTVQGTAVESASTSWATGVVLPERPLASFDPCEQIPEATIRRLGMDPAREDGVAGIVDYGGWKWCTWTSSPSNLWRGWTYSLNVAAAPQPVEMLRENRQYIDFEEVVVNGRPALLHSQTYRVGQNCFVAFASGAESVTVEVSIAGAGAITAPEPGEESCINKALRHAAAIEPHIPR